MEMSVPLWGWANIVGTVIAILTLFFVIGRWVGGVNERLNTIATTLSEIREDIKDIFGRLPPTTVVSSSPLRLTDLGQVVSQALDAKAWAKRTAEEWRDELAGKQNYEVQEFCFDYVRNQYHPDRDQKARIGTIAYENGIDRREVLNVLAIELRDALLEPEPPGRTTHSSP